MSAIRQSERSLGDLFSDLVTETRMLVRQEIALAKTELGEKAAFAGRNAGIAAAGAMVLMIGILPIIAGLVISLGHKIGYATSAFIIGALIAIAGAAVLMMALSALRKEPLKPQQTVTQIKETKQWMKEQIR